MKFSMRQMNLNEFKTIYKRIEQDFARVEYAPYEILNHQLQEDIQSGSIMMADGKEVAYSICAEGNTNHYVLISLFAVYQEFRGRGFGTAFLEALKKMYSEKEGLIIEVEKPEETSNLKEKSIREKRIQFYQKSGFQLLKNIHYAIWDVPMHLMVCPLTLAEPMSNQEIGGIMYDIYLKIMGEGYIHKMKFKALD